MNPCPVCYKVHHDCQPRCVLDVPLPSAIGSNLHLSPHTVCVPDNERERDEFYPVTLVYSAHLDRDIGEIWADDRGFCWREVNDNIRPDRLQYGHTQSQQDAIQSVVRQAGQR